MLLFSTYRILPFSQLFIQEYIYKTKTNDRITHVVLFLVKIAKKPRLLSRGEKKPIYDVPELP